MTKSLSQQLCELCGIEPHEEPSRTYDNDGKVEMYATYPDFENNNNNFVKLMELSFNTEDFFLDSCKSIAEWMFYNGEEFYNREHFLNNLIWLLDFPTTAQKEEVKQAIKETEWEW